MTTAAAIAPTFTRSQRTEKAVAILAALEPGEVATYESLSLAIGRDAQERGRHGGYCYVFRARLICCREHQMVFVAIPNVGIKREPPAGVVSKGTHRRMKIRNQTRYARKEQATIEDQVLSLTRQAQAEYYGNLALLEAIRQQTHHRRTAAREREAMEKIDCRPTDMAAFAGG